MKAFVVLAHCLSMDQQLRILPLWQGVLLSPCFNCSCVVLIIAHSSPIGEHIFNPIGHQVLILLLSPMGSWNRFKLVTYLFPLFGFCFYGGGHVLIMKPKCGSTFKSPWLCFYILRVQTSSARSFCIVILSTGLYTGPKASILHQSIPPKFINVMGD